MLGALDDLDLAHLRSDVAAAEAAVDDAEPAFFAWTAAIAARVMVSMLAETIGCFRTMCSEKRADKSIDFGSRRSRTLNRGAKRKSSKVQPRTAARRSGMPPS